MQENKFRDRLIEEMHSKNLTQVELCEKTKIPKSAMSQYVNGKITPKTDRLYLLAKALSVNPSWLMGLDVSKDMEIDSMTNEAIDLVADTYSIEEIEKAIDTLNTGELKRLSAYIEYIKAKRQENEE